MAKGTHDYQVDPRNENILININGEMFHRDEAKISVFDSGYVLGDGVWEGLRVVNGRIAFLDRHLDRLFEGAKAIDMDIGISREALTQRLDQTLSDNAMTDGVHIRLMVTRGIKATPYQDPRMTISAATIVIIPEYKSALPETVEKGIRLFTVHVRRGYPDVQDQKLNSHSKLNCITACIQATKAGADEGTSTGDYCLGGITRSVVLELCEKLGIVAREKNFSLTDVYGADEAFVTGTFAGLVPVVDIDGREIGAGVRGDMVVRLQEAYKALVGQVTAS